MGACHRAAIVVLACAGLMGLCPALALSQDYELVWSDEFNGSSVDGTKWGFDLGTGCPSLCGWGNNELQYYRSQNATVAGGHLTITAKQESIGGRNYTSARLVTRNTMSFTYGRFEMRAKLPIGQGIWPAFWLLFTDNNYGGWAAGGEIDIMEYVGQNPDEVFGTIHYGDAFPGNVYSGNDYVLPSGTFNDAFHTFALEWSPNELRWFVDGELYACQQTWYSTGGEYPAPFNHDMHILLNMAVGGNLPGPPDGTTVFPQELVVDYVRVYQRPEFEGCSIIFAGGDNGNPNGDGWFSFNGIGGGGIGQNTTTSAPGEGCAGSIDVGWGAGGSPGYFGGFGRENHHDLTGMTHFSLWVEPDAGQDYNLIIQLQEDDNGDGNISPSADDEFETTLTVKATGGDLVAGGGWQKITIPLADFVNDDSYLWGGNDILDPFAVSNGGNGELINVVATLISNSGASITFRTDRWEFTRRDGTVAGVVWDDQNGDQTRSGEPGLPGVTVELLDESLAVLDTATTTGSGAYAFSGLAAGRYTVRVDNTTVPSGAAPTYDPDGILTPDEAKLAADCSGSLTDQDFGYQATPLAAPDPEITPAVTLHSAVPNPFRSSTTIGFTLAESGPATLEVFDLAGRRVRELVRTNLGAGSHTARWNGVDDLGRKAPAGVYLYRLRAGGFQSVQRLVLIP